ncbi:MAG: hypothetical protein K0Q77_2343, partial [Anaerosporomusa subterranea]|nr:hypothetical protein [Anaerosporomusa subterranea]
PLHTGFLPRGVYLCTRPSPACIVSVALYSYWRLREPLLPSSGEISRPVLRQARTLQPSQAVEVWTFLNRPSTVSTLILYILAVNFPQCGVVVNRHTVGMPHSSALPSKKSPRHSTYSFRVDTVLVYRDSPLLTGDKQVFNRTKF